MATGGYEPVPHEDPDETDPTESEPRRTDEGDWTSGKRPRELRSSSRHQYETKKGSPTGVVNPSYEEGPPTPPTGLMEVWKEVKDGNKDIIINVGEKVQEECKALVDEVYANPDYTKLKFAKLRSGWKVVKLAKEGSVFYTIDEDGMVHNRGSSKVPKTLKEALGKTRVEKAVALDAEHAKTAKLREEKQTKEGESDRGNRVDEIESVPSETEVEERLREIEDEREQIVEGMSLREKVKYYFKKYGFTVVGILTAIGAVIGSILSNLKTGLANVAKVSGMG